jgi:hypothetical protein
MATHTGAGDTNPMRDHWPSDCCQHVFTSSCPVDCLRAVLCTATLHALIRAERAPFSSPATVGHVLDLLREERLGLAAGLGPRRIGEIRAGLVLAGLDITGCAPPANSRRPSRGTGLGRPRDENQEPPAR